MQVKATGQRMKGLEQPGAPFSSTSLPSESNESLVGGVLNETYYPSYKVTGINFVTILCLLRHCSSGWSQLATSSGCPQISLLVQGLRT